MRQELLGALFVTAVCLVVVLATYRPEKNEPRTRLVWTLLVAGGFAFLVSLGVLYVFFAYSTKAAEMNIIRAPPNF